MTIAKPTSSLAICMDIVPRDWLRAVFLETSRDFNDNEGLNGEQVVERLDYFEFGQYDLCNERELVIAQFLAIKGTHR